MICSHCGKTRGAHGRFARCPGGETQFEALPYPIETCELCRQIYWACACGSAPINGIWHRPEDIGPMPDRCRNQYHEPGREDLPMDISIHDSRFCCVSYSHHIGITCQHCGTKD